MVAVVELASLTRAELRAVSRADSADPFERAVSRAEPIVRADASSVAEGVVPPSAAELASISNRLSLRRSRSAVGASLAMAAAYLSQSMPLRPYTHGRHKDEDRDAGR